MSVEQDRLVQLEKCISDVWEFNEVLYIGAYKGRFHFDLSLKNNNCVVDILEIDDKNCDYLKTIKWIRNVFHCDVRDVNSLKLNTYDLVFWSHGPEMIPIKDIKQTLYDLWNITGGIMVLMCPWGEYEYKSTKGLKRWNMTSLYVEDFEELGFETSVLGKKDVKGSNLLAWRRRSGINS